MEYLFKTELVRLLHIPSIETCTVLNEVEAAPKLLVFNMPGFVERILVETPLDICNGLIELFIYLVGVFVLQDNLFSSTCLIM